MGIPPARIAVWMTEPHGSSRHCSPAEQARARAHRDQGAAERWLEGRGLLREVLGATLGVAPADLEIGTGPHGKPFLSNYQMDFNLSRSGPLVAVAVAGPGVGPVGVDLEQPRRLHSPERLAARLFEGDEHDRWLATTADERHIELLRRWTRSEALLKATGEGLSGGLSGAEARLNSHGWRVVDLGLPDGVVGAVAARGAQWAVTWR